MFIGYDDHLGQVAGHLVCLLIFMKKYNVTPSAIMNLYYRACGESCRFRFGVNQIGSFPHAYVNCLFRITLFKINNILSVADEFCFLFRFFCYPASTQ